MLRHLAMDSCGLSIHGRWKKSATAQGIQEMVIITFRPVVPDDVSETRMKIVSLPERKFYLYLEQSKVAIDTDL